ncbi:MAG: DUF2490 domain-containing protein [Pyrinomonadaceae bacterium]
MKLFFIFLILFVFSTEIFARQTDAQVWNDLQLILPLKTVKDAKNKNVDQIVLRLDGVARLGRDVSFPVDNRVAATLDFRVNKYLKFSSGYLYRKFEQIPNRKSYETRLTFAANLEKKFDLFTFRHRSQIEYRFLNYRPNTEVYRPRFQLFYSLKHDKKEIFAPFVSEERFYDFRQHKTTRNEFYAGVTRRLTRKVSLDLYYVRLNTNPVNANALGTILKIRLW